MRGKSLKGVTKGIISRSRELIKAEKHCKIENLQFRTGGFGLQEYYFYFKSKKFWAGVVLAFFVLVGIFTVFNWIFSLSRNIANREWEKRRWISLIEPVLVCDPVPFLKDSRPTNSLLLQAALNNIFLNSKKEYAKSEYEEMIIPQSDVEVSVSELFGEKVKIEHQNLRDLSDFYCAYHKDEGTYYVQCATQTSMYVPVIADIEKTADELKLVVGYARPRILMPHNNTGEVEPDKYMIYRLKKGKFRYGYVIVAVEEPSA